MFCTKISRNPGRTEYAHVQTGCTKLSFLYLHINTWVWYTLVFKTLQTSGKCEILSPDRSYWFWVVFWGSLKRRDCQLCSSCSRVWRTWVLQSISDSFLYFVSLHQRTPLHIAVERARTEIAKYLVDRKADITIKDDNGVNGAIVGQQYCIFKKFLCSSKC